MRVPFLLHAHLRGYPKCPTGARVPYVPIGDAMTQSYPTDAHTAAYYMPSVERRLTTGAMDLPGGVMMQLAFFDLDAASAHAGGDGSPASDAWWAETREKIETLCAIHPRLFVYRTRGGARVVGAIEPFPIASDVDRVRWCALYIGWCGYLVHRFDLHADPSCADYTRLFRLPRATRDGNAHPENLATIGDPCAIGMWAPHVTDVDRQLAPMVRRAVARPAVTRSSARPPSSYRGAGLFFYALRSRGWVGAEVEAGKFAIKCPNASTHTKGHDFDTSTILWTPGPGEEIGSIWCSHAHCQALSLPDWLGFFSRAELEWARAAAGIVRGAA